MAEHRVGAAEAASALSVQRADALGEGQRGAAVDIGSIASELLVRLSELKREQATLVAQLELERAESAAIEVEVAALSRRLAVLNQAMAKRSEAGTTYNHVIEETEAAYRKILASSQSLLHVLKRESSKLQTRHQGPIQDIQPADQATSLTE